MKNSQKHWLALSGAAVAMLAASAFVPQYAHADLVSSLGNLKMQLTGIVLPLLSVILPQTNLQWFTRRYKK